MRALRFWRAGFAALLLAATAHLAGAGEAQPLAADPALEARVMRLAEELRCLVCQNQTIADSHAGLANDLKGRVWMLNVWASWCVACRVEHPVLLEMAQNAAVPLIGLDYKDQRPDALAWLQKEGDPYQVSLSDLDGRVGLDWGVYGVPETFIIDRQGVIRFKQIGPVTPELLREKILPLLKELQG